MKLHYVGVVVEPLDEERVIPKWFRFLNMEELYTVDFNISLDAITDETLYIPHGFVRGISDLAKKDDKTIYIRDIDKLTYKNTIIGLPSVSNELESITVSNGTGIWYNVEGVYDAYKSEVELAIGYSASTCKPYITAFPTDIICTDGGSGCSVVLYTIDCVPIDVSYSYTGVVLNDFCTDNKVIIDSDGIPSIVDMSSFSGGYIVLDKLMAIADLKSKSFIVPSNIETLIISGLSLFSAKNLVIPNTVKHLIFAEKSIEYFNKLESLYISKNSKYTVSLLSAMLAENSINIADVKGIGVSGLVSELNKFINVELI